MLDASLHNIGARVSVRVMDGPCIQDSSNRIEAGVLFLTLMHLALNRPQWSQTKHVV